MKSGINYLQFTGRRYAVALYNNNSKTLVPLESTFIGNILATPQRDLVARLKKWLEYEKGQIDHEKLFDVSRKYKLKVREKREIRERFRRLIELTPNQIALALSYKIKSKEGSHSLLRKGGEEAFNMDIKGGKRIHAGNIILSGYVKSKSDARKAQIPKFRHVSITGPFNQSKDKLTSINCTGEASFYAEEKQGYTNLSLYCTHAGALSYFARENSDLIKRFSHVRGLMGGGTEIFIPFHSRGIVGEHDLDNLSVDVILNRYFNRQKLFKIGKKLSRIQEIYDGHLESLILDGRAGFEVLIDNYIFDTAKGVNAHVRNLFNMMRNYLENEGYEMAGYCLEKKDSPYETVALMFRSKDDNKEVRLLFNKEFPPVAIVRKDMKQSRIVDVHGFTEPREYNHPFSELFMPISYAWDDRTRTTTGYEVVIPSDFRIPQPLWIDYKECIAEYFPGGVDGFEKQVYKRGIKNRSNLLAIIGKTS